VALGHPGLRSSDILAAGDSDSQLTRWLDELAATPVARAGLADPVGQARVAVELGAPRSPQRGAPDRSGLPALDRYARLVTAAGERLAGYVEASRGCSHLCRHCPVPVVYRGRTRAVAVEAVLADVSSLVAAGAAHITFGDPDFLNRPAHSLEIVRQLHASFPDLSFDATVKVEHVLRHAGVWPELAAAGCLFVVSAFESVDDRVLDLLDKGHTAADEVRAVEVLRAEGIEPRPSWMPFTPWTSLGDLVELVRFVDKHDLVPNVDPVQYGIRLLLPPGSLLLECPDPQLAAALEGYDSEALSWRWRSADPRVDELQFRVALIAEQAGAAGIPAEDAFASVAAEAARAAGVPAPALSHRPAQVRPRLTESWYCCAEPTVRQYAAVGRE
jgi:Radical SAM superfamily